MLKPHDTAIVASGESDRDTCTVHYRALVEKIQRFGIDRALTLLGPEKQKRAVELAGSLEIFEEGAEAVVIEGKGVLKGAAGKRAVGVEIASVRLGPRDSLEVGAVKGGGDAERFNAPLPDRSLEFKSTLSDQSNSVPMDPVRLDDGG